MAKNSIFERGLSTRRLEFTRSRIKGTHHLIPAAYLIAQIFGLKKPL